MERMLGLCRWSVNAFRRPVRPGSPISAARVRPATYGTLGCVVRLGRVRYILTCAHLLKAPHLGHVRVVSIRGVRARDGTMRSRIRYGRVVGTTVLHADKTRGVDCTLIPILRGARVFGRFPGPIGRLSDNFCRTSELTVTRGPSRVFGVQIYGASSAYTTGYAKIGAFLLTVQDKNAGEFIIDPPLIEIKSSFEQSFDFCKEGDSGSLVVTTARDRGPRPLGLLVSRRKENLGAVGYAVPIQRVLEAIGPTAHIETG